MALWRHPRTRSKLRCSRRHCSPVHPLPPHRQLPKFRAARTMIAALCRDRAVVDPHELVCLCNWNDLDPASNVDPLLPHCLAHIPERAPLHGFSVLCTSEAVWDQLSLNCDVLLTTMSSSNSSEIPLKVTPRYLCSAEKQRCIKAVVSTLQPENVVH